MLVLGIGYHVIFMTGLRKERDALNAEGLVHAQSQFPASLTLIVAVLLLLIGLLAIFSMLGGGGPFG
jgi:putative membrane protein